MKVENPPEGYDRILQFNVYMKNGELVRNGGSNVRYTVREDNKNSYAKNQDYSFDRRGEQDFRRPQSRDRSPEDQLSPEEVGEIKSFINRVKSESHQGSEQGMEDTMFKPKPKSRDDRNMYEETRDRSPYQERKTTPKRRPEGDYVDRDQTQAFRPGRPAPENFPRYERGRDQNYDPLESGAEERPLFPKDDKYLEIYVRPKKGQPKIVYTQNGEPAEIIHRFTPKKNYDRYPVDEVESTSKKRQEIPEDYRRPADDRPYPSTSKKPAVRDPPQEDNDRSGARRNRDPYDRNNSQPEDMYEENPFKPQPRPAFPEEDRYEEEDMFRKPSPRPSRPADVQREAADPRDQDQEYANPPRYPKDAGSNRKPGLSEEEKRRYADRQKELIQALQDEKNALKDLVDKLARRLDEKDSTSPQPRNSRKDEYPGRDEQPPRRPSAIKQPPRSPRYREDEAFREPSPDDRPSRPKQNQRPSDQKYRPEWNPGPFKNQRDERDVLSPKPRKSPFDVDKNSGKTEWEMSEPYLKTHDRLSRTPPKPRTNEFRYENEREQERAHDTAYFERSRSPGPRAGDQFCGLCDVYDDKQNYQDEAYYRGLSPGRRDYQRDGQEPATYYVEGKILGKMERPSYIRDLFRPNHLG